MKQITDVSYIFSEIREKNLLYVDKTAYLHRLVANNAQNLFFIARPRRFGKSLMLSTLHAIFAGKKELFEGLAISKTDYDWQTYPVIHLDFSGVDVSTVESAIENIREIVVRAVGALGVNRESRLGRTLDLMCALGQLHRKTGKRVAVLIDNFDAPVKDSYADVEKAATIQTFLACIYGAIKSEDEHVHFAMVTGEMFIPWEDWWTRLNNIIDLSLDKEVATLLGYTDKELEANFSDQMHAHAEKMGLSYEAYREGLRAWYGNYRFSEDCETRVYAPAAIHQVLSEQRPVFASTLSEEDLPVQITNFAKRKPLDIKCLDEGGSYSLRRFADTTLEHPQSKTVFYQTGYLTFDEVYGSERYASLKVPNKEMQNHIDTVLKHLPIQALAVPC